MNSKKKSRKSTQVDVMSAQWCLHKLLRHTLCFMCLPDRKLEEHVYFWSCILIHVSSCWSREGEFVCTIKDTVIPFTTTVRNSVSLWKESSNALARAATDTQTKHRHTWQLDLDLSSHPAFIFVNYKTFPKTPIWSLLPPIYFTTDRPCVTMSQGLEKSMWNPNQT